jgi:hypothetical protein
MAIAGMKGTGTWGTDKIERPTNFRELILWLSPNGQTPLTGLLSKMKTETTDDPEFSWWEEQLANPRMALSAQITNLSTSVSFTTTAQFDAYSFVAGDLLLVENAAADSAVSPFEIVEVVSITNGTTIVVTRAVAGTTAATAVTGLSVTKLGTVFAEGTSSPEASSRRPTRKQNYCQIFKTAYELTGTALETRLRTGDPLKQERKRKSFDHSISMEMAFMFNGAATETNGTSNQPKRYTAGLRTFLTSNTTVFTTTVTEASWIEAIRPVFDYDGGGGNERLALIGNGYATRISQLAKTGTDFTIGSPVRLYGMELQRWTLPMGSVYFRTHPLMNTHGRYTYSAFFIDASSLVYRPMRNRDTKPKDNIQNNDEDTMKGMWMGEVGLEVHHERTMAYHGNLATV